MPAGRKPIPTHMKILQGNPGGRALPQDEPKPAKTARVPSPPKWLPKEARAIWRKHADALWQLGLLTVADIDALATLCETTALYHTAVEMLGKHGATWTNKETGYSQPTAWMSVRNQTLKQMQSLWSEFGLTPAARSVYRGNWWALRTPSQRTAQKTPKRVIWRCILTRGPKSRSWCG